MRAKGIVKIVLFSLLALVLTGALVFALKFDGELPVFCGGGSYKNPESYTVGSGSVAGTLSRIEVSWISGTVNIRPHDGEEIILRETGAKDTDDEMRFRLQGGTLTVHFRKSGLFWGATKHKTLELLIPQSQMQALQSVELDTASAEINVEGMDASLFSVDSASGAVYAKDCTFSSVEIDSASGDCTLEDCTVGAFEMDTASGLATLSGTVETVEFDSASGDLSITSDVAPREIEVDTASGRSEITLPADAEFSAELDSASGDLRVEGFNGRSGKDSFVCGSGFNHYSFDSASGDVIIRASATEK